MTSLGPYDHLVSTLPSEVSGLVKTVQGLMVHVFWAERYGLTLSEQRKQEAQIRPVQRKLDRLLELDGRGLAHRRPLEKKLVGNCRDFSVMLTAMLRCKGIPARARCGFGMYFLPNHGEDHWVVEYWHAGGRRWVMVDPQIDELQRKTLGIVFDPLDMPPGHFLPAGMPWLDCRAGKDDPERFGIFDMHGLWFIRGDLVRDLLALNNLEILPWDHWGLMSKKDEDLTASDWQALDSFAHACLGGDESFPAIRALYAENATLHPPDGWAA